jgi:hypothetical protein
MRIAVIVNMVAPCTRPLFARLAERDDCELLVVSETPMERDRGWQPQSDLRFEHVLLDSWTLDIARLAVGAGFKTREDAYLHVPKRPLAALPRSRPTRRSRRVGDPGDDPRHMREPADPEDGEARIPKVRFRGYVPRLRQLHVLGGPTPLRAART